VLRSFAFKQESEKEAKLDVQAKHKLYKDQFYKNMKLNTRVVWSFRGTEFLDPDILGSDAV
jgi:hypothetical protein